MRAIAEVAGTAVGELQSVSTLAAPITQQEPSALWLRRLWERMTALYGYAWVSVHGLTPHLPDSDALTVSGSTWATALAGLTGRQIAEGVRSCIAKGGEFPPNAPRFRELCLNIPSLDVVRTESHGGEPSPFTRAVWSRLDTWRYRQVSTEQADKMLAGAYRLVHDDVMRGEPLPAAPVAAIAHEVRKPTLATPEQRAAHFARISALLAGGAQ